MSSHSGKPKEDAGNKEEDKLYSRGLSTLNSFQRGIFDEALARPGKGLCLEVKQGTGKSLLSLVLNSHYTQNSGIGLFIASLSLIDNILSQIEEHYDNDYPFEVVHTGYAKNISRWRPKERTRLVITTHSLLARCYSKNALRQHFVQQRYNEKGRFEAFFDPPERPLLPRAEGGMEYFFAREWSCLFVDESQECCNITKKGCQAVCSIIAKRRILLSATPLINPTLGRILGHFLLIGYDCPRSLKQMKAYKSSDAFPGTRAMSVYRAKNEAQKEIKVVREIITHPMHPNEVKVYTMFKTVIANLNEEIEQLRQQRAAEGVTGGDGIRTLSNSILATLTYLRQSLINPTLPLTTIAINMLNSEERTELTKMMHKEINKLNLGEWLNSERCLLSSRIMAILDKLQEHQERVVIFTEYRTSIRVISHFVSKEGRKCFTLEDTMKPTERRQVLERFRKSKDGVLCLTYAIGSKGLNLQCARVALIADFTWSNLHTEQAEGRLARMGQVADEVLIYYFVCGSGVERAVLDKQLDKKEILEKLAEGKVERLVQHTKFTEFVNDIINVKDNIKLLDRIYISPAKGKREEESSEEEQKESKEEEHDEEHSDDNESGEKESNSEEVASFKS